MALGSISGASTSMGASGAFLLLRMVGSTGDASDGEIVDALKVVTVLVASFWEVEMLIVFGGALGFFIGWCNCGVVALVRTVPLPGGWVESIAGGVLLTCLVAVTGWLLMDGSATLSIEYFDGRGLAMGDGGMVVIVVGWTLS